MSAHQTTPAAKPAPAERGAPTLSMLAGVDLAAEAPDVTYCALCIASHHAAERMGIPRERRTAPALVGALIVAAAMKEES